MTCFDFAEGLRVPVRAGSGAVKDARAYCEDPETDERARLAQAVREVEADIAMLILEGAAAEAETKVETQRQEIATATNTIADLEVQIGTLKDAVAKAEHWVSSGAKKPWRRASGRTISLLTCSN